MPATNGLLLAHHKERHGKICKKLPQLPSTGQLDSQSFVELTQHGHPMALPHLGLDLVGPVNPPSRGYIWILVVTEYFTKWAKAVPLRKATRRVVANFIKENVIVRFRVPPQDYQ